MADYEPLTVETSAAIAAFIQELNIRAESGKSGKSGKSVNEETLALRMLASASASPDYDFSTIRPLNESNEATTASADGDDKFAQLTALMMGDTKPPADQVADGQVPKAPPVAILPGYNNADVSNNYGSLMDATSMCQLYANLMQVQQKPEGFNITSEAASAFAFQAKMAFDAMMGPMAGYYVFGSGVTQTYNDTIPRDQVHANLLGKVFDGFGFDKATYDALDVQLTNFVGGLANIHSENSPTNTRDFMLRLNLVPRRNVTGDESDPVYIYQPTTYLVYMKIDAQSFQQAVGKSGSVDKINFKFSMTITKCELNTRKFEANRDKFDKMFELVTGKNLKVYSELLNKQVKTDEPNPGAKK